MIYKDSATLVLLSTLTLAVDIVTSSLSHHVLLLFTPVGDKASCWDTCTGRTVCDRTAHKLMGASSQRRVEYALAQYISP